MATINLTVPDMACGACVETITKAIHALDASASVDADTQTKHVTITTSTPDAMVKDAIVAAGYTIASA